MSQDLHCLGQTGINAITSSKEFCNHRRINLSGPAQHISRFQKIHIGSEAAHDFLVSGTVQTVHINRNRGDILKGIKIPVFYHIHSPLF